ncbi:murein DD-endopeptidase MepM/ murein hydrolase activator NlpD [Sphingomonas endophytica]|uniref:Murein DD-endopeptidase MepM/ murein hydrolase activator NlpD n=1 Tax=Sphingomonas endophytica TaxID=869719 RepID=A0A7X0JDE2_9SPHN|nr:murein DD-endopeptidase MepM/ murein hydrolase activator NlpD [Sphingomonas endophytica]
MTRRIAFLAPLLAVAAAAPPQTIPPARFGLGDGLRQGALVLGTAPAGTTRLTLDGAPVAIAPDGRFVIAFDRDAKPQALLAATLSDGTTQTATLAIAPGDWRIERLPTLRKIPVPSVEFAAKRAGELAQIVAARATGSDSEGWRERFIWPAQGRISGLFGAQRIYAGEPGSYHGGVDVAKPEGAEVVAPAAGVVTLAADPPFTLEGRLLILDHGHGVTSAFLHLSRIDVRVGERVRQGQKLGLVGRTGRATGPHLHWAMTWNGARIDPLLVAGPMP